MPTRTAFLAGLSAILLCTLMPACAQSTRVPSAAELSAEGLPDEGRMPAFRGATGWLNSRPLTPEELRGKVVVVQFLTYSCINWLRTVPHARAWNAKYRDQGLVMIGVHSPEFQFEKDSTNVNNAIKRLSIDYPIVVDSNLAIWNAFENAYWPALYIVDAKGRIRHHQFGEGGYEKSERVIQTLLAESGTVSKNPELVTVDARGAEAPADWNNLGSPEAYIGYGREMKFSSPGGLVRDRSHIYSQPLRLELNQWALVGNWTVRKQAAVSNVTSGRIKFRFHGRDLHIVMGSSVPTASARFRVTVDGQPPKGFHGLDADEAGFGRVKEPRLYQLLRQEGPIIDREFQIEFLDPSVEVYSFTFG